MNATVSATPALSGRPLPPPPWGDWQPPVAPRPIGRIGVVAITMLALLAFISRRPDVWITPQFWAEDGTNFFFDAATGGWGSWFKPYAGYLNFSSRTIACLTKDLPWEFLPLVYVWSAGIIAALIVTRVACARLPLVPRLLGAVAIVAVPHSGEVFLNMTNLNWIFGALLAANLLEPVPLRRAEAWRRSCEVGVAGLSGAVVILFAPLAVVWAWRSRKDCLAWWVIAAWGAALLVQGLVVAGSSRSATTGIGQMVGSLHWIIPRYAADFFLGTWLAYDPMVGRIVAVAGVAGIGALLLERANPFRFRAGWLLLAAAIVLVAGRAAVLLWSNPFGGGGRYMYLPFVLLLWALAWLAAGTRRTGARVLAAALCGLPFMSSASMWVARPVAQFNWPSQVREARDGARLQFEVPPGHSFSVPRLRDLP